MVPSGSLRQNLLVLAALLAAPFHLVDLRVCLADLAGPAACQRFPTNISADQCRVDVYDLALGDLRGDAGGDRLLEGPAEARLAPALAPAGSRSPSAQTLSEITRACVRIALQHLKVRVACDRGDFDLREPPGLEQARGSLMAQIVNAKVFDPEPLT